MKLLGNGCGLHPVTNLGLGVGKDRAGVNIGKFGTRLLKTCGIDVGNVVCRHIQLFLRGIEPAQRNIE